MKRKNEEIGEKLEMKVDEYDERGNIEMKKEVNDDNDNRNIVGSENNNNIVLEKLYLMRNAKITEKGVDILNEIFVKKYLDDTRLEHQVVINCARCGLKSRKDNWNRTIRV